MESKPEQRQVYIVKSENDDRLYRGLELSNGMKVILISDPEIQKAAATLDVRVGFEVGDKKGLARLFQCMLYLTNKSEQQNDFKDYVELNYGSIGAETHMEFSSYYFDIYESKFKDALRHFADFFTKPFNFDETVVKEELFNIQLEYETSKLDDEWKIIKFIKWMRYTYKNRPRTDDVFETVNNDFKKKLEMFHKEYYSANVMRLCVLGTESLDVLESLVVHLFSNMKHDVVSVPNYMVSPCLLSVYRVCYVPHNDYKKLFIIFDLNDIGHYYCCSIEYFLAYLFEYDTKGSLLWELKAMGWVNSIKAEILAESRDIFTLRIDLTEEGIQHVDEIIAFFLQYANMLKESDGRTIRRLFNEYKEIQELKFRFKKKDSSLEYIKAVARSMQEWPLKYALRGKQIPIKWIPNSVKNVIDFLSPLRIMIFVTQNNGTDVTTLCTNNTNNTSFKYTISEVPTSTSNKWTEIKQTIKLNLPNYNEFIPTRHDIKLRENVINAPLRDTKFLKVWYKRDDFNEPKGTIFFHFSCRISYMSPVRALFTNMYIWLINTSLSQYVHPASLVDMHWELFSTTRGIQLKIYGYDNKLPLLLEKIVDHMINFKLNKLTFELEKQKYMKIIMKEFEQIQNDVPYLQAQSYLSFLLSYPMYEKEQILKSHDHINFKIINNFISTLFFEMYVEGLIYGNFTTREALEMTNMVETKFLNANPLRKKDMSLWSSIIRYFKLKDEHHFIFYKESKFTESTCTLIFYQIAERSVAWDVTLDIIREIFEIRYNTFRDKEMLDHIVWCNVYKSQMQGLTFLVQGSNKESYTCKNIEGKIDALVHSMMNYICKMSLEEFEAIRRFMIEKRFCVNKPKTLYDMSNVLWGAIWDRSLKFDRLKAEIKELSGLTLLDLNFAMKKLVSEKTSKLSIYVTSMKDKDVTESVFISRRYIKKVLNVEEFKNAFARLCMDTYC